MKQRQEIKQKYPTGTFVSSRMFTYCGTGSYIGWIETIGFYDRNHPVYLSQRPQDHPHYDIQ